MENINKQVISILAIVGRDFCALSGQGEKVYQEIKKYLDEDKPVVLNFKGVYMTPTFLNNAIGQLYGQYDWRKIRTLLSVEDIDPEELYLLKKVVDNAKIFFAKKENKMLGKQVQGEILEPIILRRERDEIEEAAFHHLVKNILKLCPENLKNNMKM